jgi:hypothetical protein
MPEERYTPPPMSEPAVRSLRERMGAPASPGSPRVIPSLTTQIDQDERALRIARLVDERLRGGAFSSPSAMGAAVRGTPAGRAAGTAMGGMMESFAEDTAGMVGGTLGRRGAARIASRFAPGVGQALTAGEAIGRVGGAAVGGYLAGKGGLSPNGPMGAAAWQGGAEGISFGVEAISRRYALLPRLYYALSGVRRGQGLTEGAGAAVLRMRQRGANPTLGQVLDPLQHPTAFVRLESMLENTVGFGAPSILRRTQMGAERAARADLQLFVGDLLKPTGSVTDRDDVARIVRDALEKNSETFAGVRSKKYALIDSLAGQAVVDGNALKPAVDHLKKLRVVERNDPIGTEFLKELETKIVGHRITFEQADWLRKNIGDMMSRGDSLLAQRGDRFPAQLIEALEMEMERAVHRMRPPTAGAGQWAAPPNGQTLAQWRQMVDQSWADARDFHRKGVDTFGNEFVAALMRRDPEQAAQILIPSTGELAKSHIDRLNEALRFSTANGVVPDGVMRDVRSNLLARVISQASPPTSTFYPRADVTRLDPAKFSAALKRLDEEGGLSALVGKTEASNLKELARALEISRRYAPKVMAKEATGSPGSSATRWMSAYLTGGAIGGGLYLASSDADSRSVGGGLSAAGTGGAAAYLGVRLGARALARLLASDEAVRLMVDASGAPGTKTSARAMSRLVLRIPQMLGLELSSDPEEFQIVRPGDEQESPQ